MSPRNLRSWIPSRRAADPVQDPVAPAPDPTPDPALIEVFTEGDRFYAEIDLGQERLSDMLNREGEVQAFRIERAADGSTAPESQALDVDSILLAIAPPQSNDAGRRLHRPRHWVAMHVGEHEVLGNLHVPAGAQPGGYLVRVNPRFVALTEAEIHTNGDERRTDVVLVNLRQVDRMREIGREAQNRPID